jgi:hypothetical protein
MKVIWCLYERVKNTYSIIIELENKYKKMLSHIRPRFSRQSSTSFNRGVTVRVSLLGGAQFLLPHALRLLLYLSNGKRYAYRPTDTSNIIWSIGIDHNRPIDVPLPISIQRSLEQQNEKKAYEGLKVID